MYGANYYGSVYYGEPYSKVFNITTKALSATVTTAAKLSKRVAITRHAAVVNVATLIASYQKALSRLVNAVTRSLNYTKITKGLNNARTTKRIL